MADPVPEVSPISELSLVELVDRSGFEASLITTFNANLRFYEEIVLPRLRARNCRHNFVLMDAKQCAFMWSSEATRPHYCGVEYTLIPMHVSAAFHPKLLCLLGPKRAAVAVGSHNLTLAGFGLNREITTLIESAHDDDTEAAFVHDVWEEVFRWIKLESVYAPPELIYPVLELRRFLPSQSLGENRHGSLQFLSQSDSETPLFSKLRSAVDFPPTRIAVVGAFFDSDLKFLSQMQDVWPNAGIVVGVEPGTVWLPASREDERLHFVDAERALRCPSDRYLHAKALFFDGEDEENAIWFNGSANPSAPGWGLNTANVEAGVLFRGFAARQAANNLGFNSLFDLPPLSDEELSRVVARTLSVKPLEEQDHAAFLVGIASKDRREIRIDSPAIQKLATSVEDHKFSADVSACSEAENILALEATWDNGTLILGFQEPLLSENLLRLRSVSGLNARILVHNPESVKQHSSSSAQRQISDAIGALDDSSADLSEILAVVTKVIFSENTEELLRNAEKKAHTGVARTGGNPIEHKRPETLEAEFSAKRDKQKKLRMLSHGDLVELIDALKQKLYVAPPIDVERSADGTGGPEDGNGLGIHSTGGGEEDKRKLQLSLTDLQIALAVATKSRTLVNRMVARERAVAEQYSRMEIGTNGTSSASARALVMQLVLRPRDFVSVISELLASLPARELPVDGDSVAVHFPVPCHCFALELIEGRDSPLAQTLTREQADLDLSLVQPTAVFRGVVHRETLPQQSADCFAEPVHQRLPIV